MLDFLAVRTDMEKHGTKFHGASRQKELLALQEDQDTYVGGLDRPGRRAGQKSTDPARHDSDDATVLLPARSIQILTCL